MKNFDTRVYNISDFSEWNSSGLLDLSPEFQRRPVWSEIAKSYLIDTIIKGKPFPKIIISQNLKQSRNIRVVVDGQQRLRTILSFIDGDFKISKAHNKDLAGMRFSDLDEGIKNDFMKYEIGVDILFDQRYEDILDIFARLNTYSVKLNPQELLNAKYLGYFKQTAYSLGYRYVSYWVDAAIMSKAQVSRMAEAELASDLLVALVAGIQTNKAIPTYYKMYEDKPGPLEKVEENFDTIMTFLGEIYPSSLLKSTNFKRIHLFYSLFCSIAHSLFGISNIDIIKPPLNKNNLGRARVCFDEVSVRFDEEPPSKEYEQFIDYSRRATTDATRRIYRSKFLCNKLLDALSD
jgi:hypothetical protein